MLAGTLSPSPQLFCGASWEQRVGRDAAKWKLENETGNHRLETPSAGAPFPQGESRGEREGEEGAGAYLLKATRCSSVL